MKLHNALCWFSNYRKGWIPTAYDENRLELECRRCGIWRTHGERAPTQQTMMQYLSALNAGKLRFWTDRLAWYPQKISTLLIFPIALKQFDLSLWWLLLLPVFIVAAYLFDAKRVVGGELSSYNENNPAWLKLVAQVEEIQHILKAKP